MKNLKYAFFSLLCMLIMSSNVLAADEVVKNIRNFEENSHVGLMYHVVEIEDGYLAYYPDTNYDNDKNVLWFAKYDKDGNFVDEVILEYEDELLYHGMTEHSKAYKVSEELVILSTYFTTITVNPKQLEKIDENDTIGCTDIIAYNGNFLCVGDDIYEGRYNDLKLISDKLKIIDTKTFEEGE